MPARDADDPRDLMYVEEARRSRSLHVLMQDTGARGNDARIRFLKAGYREVVGAYQRPGRLEPAVSLLRNALQTLDRLTREVDTRVDDYGDLGVYVLAREMNSYYLLCTRGGSARIRVNGVFVPVSTPDLSGVRELSIESARAQRDLFTPTLPDSLVLYRIDRGSPPGSGGRLELMLGGDADDAVAAVDTLELRRQERGSVVSERARHAVLYVDFDPADTRAATGAEPVPAPRVPFVRRVTWAAAATMIVAAIGGLAVTRPWERRADVAPARHEQASHERTVALSNRRAAVERPVVAVPTTSAPESVEDARAVGFRLAWEKAFGAAVTSSPSPLGTAIVFGARDGKVYALDRESGARVWSYTAGGGVGASPVVRGDAVVAADYAGTVSRLSRSDGRAAWKRALREKIVSTPAVDGVRVAVGTVSGNVYALSFETGRVLWKFRTRGQVRGAIVHARDTYFVPSHDGRVYALADDTGARRWAAPLGGPVSSSPASDGSIVVVGTAAGKVVALDAATGKQRWTFAARGAVNSGVEIVDGRVYVGGERGLYCLEASSGELAWKGETGGAVLSRPFVGDGTVVATSYDHGVYCFDAKTGRLVDRYETSESIFSSPVVVDGRVFFGNNDGRFYCLETPRS